MQGDHYPLAQQVNHFRNTVSSLTRMFRGNTTRVTEYLGKCIYFMGMGSNDYLNNYFMPAIYSTSQDYSPKTYAALLIQDYSRQLTVSIYLSINQSISQSVCPIDYKVKCTGNV